MSALIELAEFIENATTTYRKGPEVSEHDAGNLHVVEVYAMPPAEEASESAVDVGFMLIGFTDYATDQARFEKLLAKAVNEEGEYYTFTPDEFFGGPSYITAGGWIGSQDLALRLYALMEHYGLAKVVTPKALGIEGDLARELMGGGLVLFSPTEELAKVLKS